MDRYIIETADTREKYEGLRDLWMKVFGDEKEVVDAVYSAFDGLPAVGQSETAGDGKGSAEVGKGSAEVGTGSTEAAKGSAKAGIGSAGAETGSGTRSTAYKAPDIAGYIIRNEAGKVVSALTCYKCGEMYVPPYYGEEEEEEEAAGRISGDAGASSYKEINSYKRLDGKPVYVSYAICTDPDYRGLGLAARLTEYVRNIVTAPEGAEITCTDGKVCPEKGRGGISIVSPAERSLEDYYAALGYSRALYSAEATAFPEVFMPGFDLEDDDEDEYGFGYDDPEDARIWGLDLDGVPGFIDADEYDAYDPGLTVQPVDASLYNRYREAFLADIPHVAISPKMMDLVRVTSMDGNGLMVINNGDAICVLSDAKTDAQGKAQGNIRRLFCDELLVNPMLTEFSEEIDFEIASRLARHQGLDRLIYRTPGYGQCQAMMAAQENCDITGYFGFPIE